MRVFIITANAHCLNTRILSFEMEFFLTEYKQKYVRVTF